MPFAATSWLSDIVRTSDYRLPDFHPELGDINISAEELILALASVRHLPIDDSPSAALNPARIPIGSAIPSALALHFEDVVQGLSVYGMDLHPAVRHALLAVALASPDKNEKLDALKPLIVAGQELLLRKTRLDFWQAHEGTKHGQRQGFVILALVLREERN